MGFFTWLRFLRKHNIDVKIYNMDKNRLGGYYNNFGVVDCLIGEYKPDIIGIEIGAVFLTKRCWKQCERQIFMIFQSG